MKSKKYKEIFKLKRMLEKENIPFEWIECFGYPESEIKKLRKIAPDISEHYQICYPCKDDKKIWISVIEGFGTYGSEQDRLEIMGGFTPWVLNTDCEREVENAYNYGMKLEKKIFIAHLVKEERMRRQVELNKANQERAFERTQKGVQGFIK